MGLLAWIVGLAACVVLCRMTAGARSLDWESTRDGGVWVGRFGKDPEKPDLIGFAVPVPQGVEFDLRRETAFDRLFYRLGVGCDTAIGGDVDGIVHFACSSPSLVAALRADPMRRALLRQLVFAIDSGGYKNLGVSCRDGRLELLFRRAGDASPSRLQRVVAPRLLAVQQALPAPDFSERLMPLPSDGERAAWLVAVCHGLLLNAVLQGARLFFTGPPFIIERADLFVAGLFASALLFVALLYTVLRGLGASPRATTVLFAAMFSGAVGCLLSGPSLARDANISLDFSAPQRISMTATERRGRRGQTSTTYSVGSYGRFRISGRASSTFVMGDRRAGALGIAWVGNVRPFSVLQLMSEAEGRKVTEAEYYERMRAAERRKKNPPLDPE